MLKARALFKKYDTDGNGTIDKDELEHIFDELGHKPSPELMSRLDPDGSGTISFMEFVGAYDIWAEILKPNTPMKKEQRTAKGSKEIKHYSTFDTFRRLCHKNRWP